MALNTGRGSSGFGPSPLSYSDILAFQQLSGLSIRPWEVIAIKLLDSEYLVANLEQEAANG